MLVLRHARGGSNAPRPAVRGIGGSAGRSRQTRFGGLVPVKILRLSARRVCENLRQGDRRARRDPQGGRHLQVASAKHRCRGLAVGTLRPKLPAPNGPIEVGASRPAERSCGAIGGPRRARGSSLGATVRLPRVARLSPCGRRVTRQPGRGRSPPTALAWLAPAYVHDRSWARQALTARHFWKTSSTLFARAARCGLSQLWRTAWSEGTATRSQRPGRRQAKPRASVNTTRRPQGTNIPPARAGRYPFREGDRVHPAGVPADFRVDPATMHEAHAHSRRSTARTTTKGSGCTTSGTPRWRSESQRAHHRRTSPHARRPHVRERRAGPLPASPSGH